MQYFTITENTYEEAVKKAKELYGEGIRVNSRRDYTTSGGLFTRKVKKCEITCYLVKNSQKDNKVYSKELNEFELEARTPDPLTLTEDERLNTHFSSEINEIESKAGVFLRENYFSGELKETILDSALRLKKGNLIKRLSDAIIDNVLIDYQNQINPKRYMVFLGPTGTGKTTTLAKVAYLYKKEGKKIAIISLDSYRTGAFEQIKEFAKSFDIPISLVKDEDEIHKALERFSWYDLVLIDTMGLGKKDLELQLRLKGLLSALNKEETVSCFVSSPSMKEEDLLDQLNRYEEYNISTLILTKLDESETIGNALSFSYKSKLPLLFFTDGQKVPEDIKKVSTSLVLANLKDLELKFENSETQLLNQN